MNNHSNLNPSKEHTLDLKYGIERVVKTNPAMM